MSKPPVSKARLARAYVIKAAESRPSLPAPKRGGHASAPTEADKGLVDALLRARRAS